MENIKISGQAINIGQSLQQHVSERVNEITHKYFEKLSGGSVNFVKTGPYFQCDILLNDATGRHTLLKGGCKAEDIYQAFDSALSKIAKQLRKYKSKLKDRHNKVKLSETSPSAMKYIISSNKDSIDQEFDTDNPVIIAEKATEILSLSVGDAVMHMDMLNLPTLMFENIKTGRINVVYYRKDGNISWVDSK